MFDFSSDTNCKTSPPVTLISALKDHSETDGMQFRPPAFAVQRANIIIKEKIEIIESKLEASSISEIVYVKIIFK